MREPLVSVVIPAHDEQSVIGRCLDVLTADALPGEIDVIVVANACTDRTAEVARAAGAVVVETTIPGKANAIRLGDERCRTFPRLYLDADIDLSTSALRRMVEAAGAPGVHACAPLPSPDVTGSSWVVRGFQRVLAELMAGRAGLAGTGAYLLDEVGHGKVFPMPDVISDDGYVHRSIPTEHQLVVTDVRVVTRQPHTVAAVVRRRARVRLGNRELDRLGTTSTEGAVGPGALLSLVRAREVRLLDAGCFLAVLFTERALAAWRAKRGTTRTWSSDRTTRQPVP